MIHRRHTLRATHDFTQTPPHSWGGPPTQLFYERRRHIIKTLLHILIHCIILFVLKVSAKCLQTTTTTTTNQSAANSIERLGCGRHDSSFFFEPHILCVCLPFHPVFQLFGWQQQTRFHSRFVHNTLVYPFRHNWPIKIVSKWDKTRNYVESINKIHHGAEKKFDQVRRERVTNLRLRVVVL